MKEDEVKNVCLNEIRPWTLTQADIEGYEDIHVEKREDPYNEFEVKNYHSILKLLD